MTTSHTTLELIPKSTTEKLHHHEKLIKSFIAGQRKGAGDLFGYAFLTGHQLLAAKADIPNGNSGTPNAGFKNWVEATFPDLGMRTAERWMVFAEDVRAQLSVVSGAKHPPLMLGEGGSAAGQKMNNKKRNFILGLVAKVMDGKSMTQFMRDSRLLRDPEKPTHTTKAPKSKQEANKARVEQARRVAKGICADYDTAAKVMKWTPADDLKQLLERTIDFGNQVREQLKKLKAAPATPAS